jgi:DMSO/TMAO reductase YedYZ molybdopterin-dependent catalytic subunit
MAMATRGFFGGRRIPEELAARLPPGQHVEEGFPVLTAGPTPHIPLEEWSFTVEGLVREPRTWNWEDAHALPGSQFDGDIHCVTRWSKFNVNFSGVSVDTLLDLVGVDEAATHVLAYCHEGYTTNLPLADLRGGRAWIAWEFGGSPLAPEHGGPARLLVPHLYFWKSAKWIKGLRLLDHDEPGFWEQYGYHDYGDPWKEQRFQGD